MIPREASLTPDAKHKVTRLEPDAMISFRARTFDKSLKDDISRVALCDVPADHRMTIGNEVAIAWMAPDEILLFCPATRRDALMGALKAASDGADVMVTDVSDARCHFALTGPNVREVMARLTPADVSPGALPVGTFRRSRVGQVAAAFWLSDEETINLLAYRSVADYVSEVLSFAAQHAAPLALFTTSAD